MPGEKAQRRVHEDAGDRVSPVGLVRVDPPNHVGRRSALGDVEAVEADLPRPTVVGVPADGHAFVLAVLGEVVRASRMERSDSLAARRKVRWDRAEERHRRPCEEVRRRPREPHHEGVPARHDAARRLAPTFEDVDGSDDVLHVDRARGVDEGLQRSVDGVSEGTRAYGGAVREPEALVERERVRLEIRRDAVAGGNLPLEPVRGRRRLVRVGHEARAGCVQERPSRLGERQRGVDVVEARRRRELDPEDPSLLAPRAGRGLREQRRAEKQREQCDERVTAFHWLLLRGPPGAKPKASAGQDPVVRATIRRVG